MNKNHLQSKWKDANKKRNCIFYYNTRIVNPIILIIKGTKNFVHVPRSFILKGIDSKLHSYKRNVFQERVSIRTRSFQTLILVYVENT